MYFKRDNLIYRLPKRDIFLSLVIVDARRLKITRHALFVTEFSVRVSNDSLVECGDMFYLHRITSWSQLADTYLSQIQSMEKSFFLHNIVS